MKWRGLIERKNSCHFMTRVYFKQVLRRTFVSNED